MTNHGSGISPWLISLAFGFFIGFPLVNEYVQGRASQYVSERAKTCRYMPYFVPPDGSASLEKCARAEGLRRSRAISAYREIALKRLLPGLVTDSNGSSMYLKSDQDEAGTLYWRPVEITADEWSNELPKNRWVVLPDIDGNGSVGNGTTSEYYRDLNRDAQADVWNMYERQVKDSNQHIPRQGMEASGF